MMVSYALLMVLYQHGLELNMEQNIRQLTYTQLNVLLECTISKCL